jgi:hypothetical protein
MLSWTELKQLCSYLCSAKHHFRSETDIEYNNIAPDEHSDMEFAQPLTSVAQGALWSQSVSEHMTKDKT